jgi:hypothetical protein
MRKCFVAACFSFLAAMSAVAAAPGSSPSPASSLAPAPSPTSILDFAKNRLDTMLRTGHSDSTWFSASFLAGASAHDVDDVIAQRKSVLGEYRSLEFTPAKFVAHFAKGTDDVLMHIDVDLKIDGLIFALPVKSP